MRVCSNLNSMRVDPCAFLQVQSYLPGLLFAFDFPGRTLSLNELVQSHRRDQVESS